MKLESYITTCTKTHDKSVNGISVRPKTLKLLVEKTEKILYNIGTDFLVVQEVRPADEWDPVELKKPLHDKGGTQMSEGTEYAKIFSINVFYCGLTS